MSPKSLLIILFLTSIDGVCLDDCSQHGDCVWNHDRGTSGGRYSNSSYSHLFRCDCDLGYKGISCNETDGTIPIDPTAEKKIDDIKKELDEEKEEEKNMNRIFGNELTAALIISYVFGGIGFIITTYTVYRCIKRRRNASRERKLREMNIIPQNPPYTSIDHM